jgi:acetylornithine aminotransferase
MNEYFSQIQHREQQVLCQTYARYPLEIVSGQGTKVFDAQGRPYLDLLAGIAVCGLGHCHPEISEVIEKQSKTLVHVSNLFYQKEQVELAEKLCNTCHLQRVFFCNSGAEANEAAIKLSRRYMRKIKSKEAFEIITLKGSFHGRTLATLTATGQDKVKEGFDPLPDGFVSVPFDDIFALRDNVHDHTAAILVEIIQGEGGIRPLSSEYLLEVQKLCHEQEILFLVDEIQSGMGRTGKMWAFQHMNLKPDMMTSAKSLANGLPMGALLVSEEMSRGFAPGSHATTFGGGPLVSAVASRVLDIIERDNLCAHAQKVGEYCRQSLRDIQKQYPQMIADIRGCGLMIGVEFRFPAKSVWEALWQKGYICNLTQEKVLRLLPPLIITYQEIEEFCEALTDILATMTNISDQRSLGSEGEK